MCVRLSVQALANSFLQGSLPLDSFLDNFLSLRSLAHKRRVRTDKLQEILRQRSEGIHPALSSSATSSSAGMVTSQDGEATPPPWGQTQTNPQPNSTPSPAGVSTGLPYSPYPLASANPSPAAASGAASSGPANPPPQFPPYPGSASPFTPAGGYPAPRPAFGPPPAAASSCPYPSQPSFPAPHPGSAFGQYTPLPPAPQGSTAPYPASYSYGGYSYPAAGPAYSSSQSPTGRPVYRPGYGVPQPYS